jgi:uncharacterized protein
MAHGLSDGEWLNPPESWDMRDEALSLSTLPNTDFWRKTHYGFLRDNGHFWQQSAPLEFTAMLTFEGEYKTLYDQAGLMMRLDAENWIKCGIEHSDGMTNFSIVVTRGQSDWSVVGQPIISGPQTVRLTAQKNSVIAHFMTATGQWQLMRVADFPTAAAGMMIGPVACSPERGGFKARFLNLDVIAPIDNPLHG